MKLLKKADEMEMSINFKSMRLAWVFENIALFIWTVLSFIYNNENVFILIMIISMQNIIFFGSKLYIARKMTGNNNEK